MLLELEEAIDLLQEFNGVSVTVRVLLAAVLGGLVGSERGRRGRAAGMRTHVLVCLGAAMTSMVGLYSAEVLGFTNDPPAGQRPGYLRHRLFGGRVPS